MNVEPGRHYMDRRDTGRIVTVTKVFSSIVDGRTAVAYDIWEPGYEGPPGSWGSAVSIDQFRALYRPDGDENDAEEEPQ